MALPATRFDRLWHDTVVSRDDEHDQVGYLRPTRPHRGERLVARSIDEGDETLTFACVHRHLEGTCRLGDAASFTLGDLRLANAVQEGCLAVVNVSENGDDCRARALIGELARLERLHDFIFG